MAHANDSANDGSHVLLKIVAKLLQSKLNEAFVHPDKLRFLYNSFSISFVCFLFPIFFILLSISLPIFCVSLFLCSIFYTYIVSLVSLFYSDTYIIILFIIILYYYCVRRNSEQTMAVAIATFKLSALSLLVAKVGMSNLLLMHWRTS